MAGALREVFARFGVEVDATKLDKLKKNVDSGAEKLRKFGGALAAGLIGRTVAHFVKGLEEQGSAIQDNALKLGLTTDAYQQLGYAASVSGADVETMTLALLGMQDNLAGAVSKGGDAAAMFSSLGIKLKDSSGKIRDTESVYNDAADAIAKMKDPARQTEAAMNLFGKAGKRLLPLLKGGSEETKRLRLEAIALGGGFSKEAVTASDEFGDALTSADFAVTSLRGRLAVALLPMLQKLVGWFIAGAKKLMTFVSHTRMMQGALRALGVVLAAFAIKSAIAMAPLLAPFLLFGAIVAGLYLALNDVYVWLKGGKSLTGEWLEKLYGAERANEILRDMRAVFDFIGEAIGRGVGRLQAFLGFVNEIYPKVEKIVSLLPPVLIARAAKYIGGKAMDGAAVFGDAVGQGQVAAEDAAYSYAHPRAASSNGSLVARGRLARESMSSVINQTFNAPGMDERRLASFARQEAEKLQSSTFMSSAQSLTSEAPPPE